MKAQASGASTPNLRATTRVRGVPAERLDTAYPSDSATGGGTALACSKEQGTHRAKKDTRRARLKNGSFSCPLGPGMVAGRGGCGARDARSGRCAAAARSLQPVQTRQRWSPDRARAGATAGGLRRDYIHM